MKFTAATLLALPLLAVATPMSLEARQSAGTCDTGTLECCGMTISVGARQGTERRPLADDYSMP